VPDGAELEAPAALRQGENSAGEIGYRGPCPPEGQHHYVFRVLALDTELALPARADRAAFDEAVTGHTIAEARLTAVYERP
jgi:Raf kinase inhibitor-like YbhB/YbcL family protein